MKNFIQTGIALVIMFAPNLAYALENIASVTMVKGGVFKIVDGAPSALETGHTINLNDTIFTEDDGEITLTFIDETLLALGNGTDLTIDEYVFDPENVTDNKASFNITRGPFHYISGLIAKKEDPDVTLKLDFGSIGIRGTKIWRDMTLDAKGQLQCRIYLEDGRARVSNKKGFTTLGDGDGTRIVGMDNAPTRSKPWGEAKIAEIKAASPILLKTEKIEEE